MEKEYNYERGYNYKHRMRHCHENDSRITDQPPGGGYSQEDVPRGKILECTVTIWGINIYFADPIMEICFLGS